MDPIQFPYNKLFPKALIGKIAANCLNTLTAGGTIDMPIADQEWGDYHGSLTDKCGVHWMVNYGYPKEI